MPTLVEYTSAQRTIFGHSVYVKDRWSADWEYVPYLYCERCDFVANPGIARAQLNWRYGNIQQPGRVQPALYTPLSLQRKFVKVELEPSDGTGGFGTQPIVWYGIVEEEQDVRQGTSGSSPAVRTGQQVFTCYGLEILLERHIITESVFLGPSGQEVRLRRGLAFNNENRAKGAASEQLAFANRSAETGAKGTYLFAYDSTTAEPWSALQAAAYLLAYESPRSNLDNVPLIRWRLDLSGLGASVSDWDKPRLVTHGRNLKDVLDSLITRRRGLGYTVEVDAASNDVTVRVFSFLTAPLVFNGGDLPANNRQVNLSCGSCPAVLQLTIGRSQLESVDQVVAMGPRMIACFSLFTVHSTLAPGWTDDQAEAYSFGGAVDPDTGLPVDGFADLDVDEKQRRNNDARAMDRHTRAFSYFGLSANWDGLVSYGENGASRSPYFPSVEDIGVPLPLYPPEARFLNRLPLKTDHDYSGNFAVNGPVNNTPDNQLWEYLPIISLLKLSDTSAASGATRYAHLDRLAANAANEVTGDGNGRKWSASTRAQELAPGVVIRVSGAPQHVLAGSDFTAQAVDETEELGNASWRDGIIVTVALQVDASAEARYPADNDLPDLDAVRRMLLDAGDTYQRHYVAPGTVFGVRTTDGELITSESSGFVRDDQEQLLDLARLAYEWYAIERATLGLGLGFLSRQLAVGDLILSVIDGDQSTTVNTVVTSVRFELPEAAGSGPAGAATIVQTGFADLDPKGLLLPRNA